MTYSRSGGRYHVGNTTAAVMVAMWSVGVSIYFSSIIVVVIPLEGVDLRLGNFSTRGSAVSRSSDVAAAASGNDRRKRVSAHDRLAVYLYSRPDKGEEFLLVDVVVLGRVKERSPVRENTQSAYIIYLDRNQNTEIESAPCSAS
ncbi:hypothetical protein J6590_027273 [Homalodisca vitripennis]|nr:hypothetical protein J6590_091740 [Homalodisca vitripennis]KAG8287934.1 hypothetical protein J6590_027273 [Homalodisca vitripennis]